MLPQKEPVPNFSLRFNRGVLALLILSYLLGSLTTLRYLSAEEGDGVWRHKATLVLIATTLVCILLTIAGASKFACRHLWGTSLFIQQIKNIKEFIKDLRNKKAAASGLKKMADGPMTATPSSPPDTPSIWPIKTPRERHNSRVFIEKWIDSEE